MQRKYPSQELSEIREIYSKLYDIKEEIQQHFSLPLLLSITAITVDLVFFLFLKIIQFQYGTEGLTPRQMWMLFLWGQVPITRLVTIVSVSDVLPKRMKENNLIVARMWPKVMDQYTKNEVSKKIKCSKLKILSH